jgi:hypothetical protein
MAERSNKAKQKKPARKAAPAGAPPSRNAEFAPDMAAAVLLDALYRGDADAASEWNIEAGTIRAWRRRLRIGTTPEDDTLRELFQQQRAAFRDKWADDAADTMIAANAYVRRAAQSGILLPEMVGAVVQASSYLKAALTTDRMIDASRPNRPPEPLPTDS